MTDDRRLAIPPMGPHVPPHERRKVLELVARRLPFAAFDLAVELDDEYSPRYSRRPAPTRRPA